MLIQEASYLEQFKKHESYPCILIFQATQFGQSYLAASWSESKKVHIWRLDKTLQSINDPSVHGKVQDEKPLFSFSGHLAEGFAMDWCQTTPGSLYRILLVKFK